MILGIGMDIVEIRGMARQLADHASVFEQETFTAQERRTAQSRASSDATRHLAVRFAAKEAFIKAWSCANRGRAPQLSHVHFHDIEVIQDAFGRPSLCFHGEVAQALKSLGQIQTHVSLTHDGGSAAAVVILERLV